MKISSKKLRLKNLHLSRVYRFHTQKVPEVVEYFEPKRDSFLALILTIILFFSFFFLSDYKEMALRIGIIAVFYNLYKIYKVFTQPCLKLSNFGIELRSVRVSWKNIKKINTDFENNHLNLTIYMTRNKIVKEKIENFPFFQNFNVSNVIRAFKKKYRNQLIIEKLK